MRQSGTDDRDSDSALRAQLAERDATIHQLREELAETNQGVVALYAELDDKNQALREASELKSRFLSYMSHEFRTPLGAVRSIARLLLDEMDGHLNEEQMKQEPVAKPRIVTSSASKLHTS